MDAAFCVMKAYKLYDANSTFLMSGTCSYTGVEPQNNLHLLLLVFSAVSGCSLWLVSGQPFLTSVDNTKTERAPRRFSVTELVKCEFTEWGFCIAMICHTATIQRDTVAPLILFKEDLPLSEDEIICEININYEAV